MMDQKGTSINEMNIDSILIIFNLFSFLFYIHSNMRVRVAKGQDVKPRQGGSLEHIFTGALVEPCFLCYPIQESWDHGRGAGTDELKVPLAGTPGPQGHGRA